MSLEKLEFNNVGTKGKCMTPEERKFWYEIQQGITPTGVSMNGWTRPRIRNNDPERHLKVSRRMFRRRDKELNRGKYIVNYEVPTVQKARARQALDRLGFTWQQFTEALLYALWTDGPSPDMNAFEVINQAMHMPMQSHKTRRYITTHWPPSVYRRMARSIEYTGPHWRGNVSNFLAAVWTWAWSSDRQIARSEAARLAVTIENISRTETDTPARIEPFNMKLGNPNERVSPRALLQADCVMCLPALFTGLKENADDYFARSTLTSSTPRLHNHE